MRAAVLLVVGAPLITCFLGRAACRYERLAKLHLRNVMEKSGRTFVYMNISIGDDAAGKVIPGHAFWACPCSRVLVLGIVMMRSPFQFAPLKNAEA